jgi:hypothetical protein
LGKVNWLRKKKVISKTAVKKKQNITAPLNGTVNNGNIAHRADIIIQILRLFQLETLIINAIYYAGFYAIQSFANEKLICI